MFKLCRSSAIENIFELYNKCSVVSSHLLKKKYKQEERCIPFAPLINYALILLKIESDRSLKEMKIIGKLNVLKESEVPVHN